MIVKSSKSGQLNTGCPRANVVIRLESIALCHLSFENLALNVVNPLEHDSNLAKIRIFTFETVFKMKKKL